MENKNINSMQEDVQSYQSDTSHFCIRFCVVSRFQLAILFYTIPFDDLHFPCHGRYILSNECNERICKIDEN